MLSPFSRAKNCCSAFWFSTLSRMRKPWPPPAVYIAVTCAVTVHVRQPLFEPDGISAAGPVVAGWLLQVTPISVHDPVTRSAWMVRPLLGLSFHILNVADWTTQPVGTVPIGNRTTERRFPPDFDITLRLESEPLFSDTLPELNQASASACSVTVVVAQTGADETVQFQVYGVASRLPDASLACTANVWAPMGTADRLTGDVHGVKATPSSQQSKLPGSLLENWNDAVVSVVVPVGPETPVVSGGVRSVIVHVYVVIGGSVMKAGSSRRTC